MQLNPDVLNVVNTRKQQQNIEGKKAAASSLPAADTPPPAKPSDDSVRGALLNAVDQLG